MCTEKTKEETKNEGGGRKKGTHRGRNGIGGKEGGRGNVGTKANIWCVEHETEERERER